jgi:hypothetical protein
MMKMNPTTYGRAITATRSGLKFGRRERCRGLVSSLLY